jgi:hypothetical protein
LFDFYTINYNIRRLMVLTEIEKDNNLRNFNRSSIVWFIIYSGIALVISFTIPFPISLIVYIGIYLFLQSYSLNPVEKDFTIPQI